MRLAAGRELESRKGITVKGNLSLPPNSPTSSDSASGLRHIDRQLWKKVQISIAVLACYGFFLPENWQQPFGVLAVPIEFVASTVPAISKMALVSPIPNLVNGFLGLAYLAIPIVSFWLFIGDSIALRCCYFRDQLTASPIKKGLFGYVIGIPVLAVIVWLFWEFPGNHGLSLTPTRGRLIYSIAVSNQILLSVLGAVAAVALSICLWVISLAIAMPVFILLGSDKPK